MITEYNITPLSPIEGSSDAFVHYSDLGPRPICEKCDSSDECPTCSSDVKYFQPVVAGDLIYLQFRLTDAFNSDPENPVDGWKNGDDNYWIEATVESNNGDELPLDQQPVIAGKSVGYFNGSYQNLILDSQKIQDWLYTIPTTNECFRIRVNTYSKEYPEHLVVYGVYSGSPVGGDWEIGTIIAVDTGGFLIFTGIWTTYESSATLIYSMRHNAFMEYDGGWDKVMVEYNLKPYQECYTSWMKFMRCEETVIIEGLHGESDCNGFYYGGDEGSRFRDRYRIPASFEFNGSRTDKVINENNIVTESTTFELWQLRSKKALPYYWVRRLLNTNSSGNVYVNGNYFDDVSDIGKVNDDGLDWFIDAQLTKKTCHRKKGCADEVFATPIELCPERTCPEVGEPVELVGEDGVYHDTAACGTIKEIPHVTIKDDEGNIIATRDAGEEYICTSAAEPAFIHNSDDSFTQNVECGSDYELEDTEYQSNFAWGSVSPQSLPSMVDHEVTVNWI